VTSRARSAGFFFLAGVGFVALVEALSTVACNDSCPAWFSWVVTAQLLFPLVWAVVGGAAPQGRRFIWFVATMALSAAIVYGIHQQTLSFTTRAISG
jgi:hypothetical protein